MDVGLWEVVGTSSEKNSVKELAWYTHVQRRPARSVVCSTFRHDISYFYSLMSSVLTLISRATSES